MVSQLFLVLLALLRCALAVQDLLPAAASALAADSASLPLREFGKQAGAEATGAASQAHHLLPGGLGRALRSVAGSQDGDAHSGSSGRRAGSHTLAARRILAASHSDVAVVNDIAGHFEVLGGVMVVLHQLGVTPDVYFAGEHANVWFDRSILAGAHAEPADSTILERVSQ